MTSNNILLFISAYCGEVFANTFSNRSLRLSNVHFVASSTCETIDNVVCAAGNVVPGSVHSSVKGAPDCPRSV